jgi:hypothetical protein
MTSRRPQQQHLQQQLYGSHDKSTSTKASSGDGGIAAVAVGGGGGSSGLSNLMTLMSSQTTTQRQKRKASHTALDTKSAVLPLTAASSTTATVTGGPSTPKPGPADFFTDLIHTVVPASKKQIQHEKKSDVVTGGSKQRRKFQVHVPCRLMVVLATVFLILPLIVFMQKEAHIHEDHDEAHYKSHKYINVRAADAMAEFNKHVNARAEDIDSSGNDVENDDNNVNASQNNKSGAVGTTNHKDNEDDGIGSGQTKKEAKDETDTRDSEDDESGIQSDTEINGLVTDRIKTVAQNQTTTGSANSGKMEGSKIEDEIDDGDDEDVEVIVSANAKKTKALHVDDDGLSSLGKISKGSNVESKKRAKRTRHANHEVDEEDDDGDSDDADDSGEDKESEADAKVLTTKSTTVAKSLFVDESIETDIDRHFESTTNSTLRRSRRIR